MNLTAIDGLVKALLHTLWQGGIIYLLLSMALAQLPVRWSRWRYGLSLLALLAVVLAGVFTWALMDQAPSARPIPLSASSPRMLEKPSEPRAFPLSPTPSVIPTPTPSLQPSAPWLTPKWTTRLGVLWGIGVLISLVRCINSFAGVQQWRKASHPLNDPILMAMASDLSRRLGIRHHVDLLLSHRVASPAAIGIWRPAILLPASLVTGMPQEYLRAVLAHELAHLARKDHLVHLIERLLEALLFFNPFVWWITRQIQLEREACCDRIASDQGAGESLYVEALLACAGAPSSPLPSAASGLGQKGESTLIERVRRLLAPEHRGSVRVPWFTFAAVMVATSLSLWSISQSALWATQKLTPRERIEQIEKLQQEITPIITSEGTITLSGKVVTPEGQLLPVNGSVLVTTTKGNHSTTSSHPLRDGVFRSKLPAGEIDLVVNVEGYAPAYLSGLHGNGDLTDLRLTLKKGYPAKIMVTDPEGNPLAGVAITGRYLRQPSARSFKALTDINGEATLTSIGPEAMMLEASKTGFQTDRKDGINLKEEEPLPWILQPAPPVLSRMVAKETGAPITGGKVRLIQRVAGQRTEEFFGPGEGPVLATTNPMGAFVLDQLRADAVYALEFKAEGFQPLIQWNLTPGNFPTEIPMPPPLHLKGKALLPPGHDGQTLEIRCEQSVRVAPHHLSGTSTVFRTVVQGNAASFEFRDLYAAETTLSTTLAAGRLALPEFNQSLEQAILDLTQTPPPSPVPTKRKVRLLLIPPNGAPAATGAVTVRHQFTHASSQSQQQPVEKGEVRMELETPNRLDIEPQGLAGYYFEPLRDVEVEEGSDPLEIRLPLTPAGAISGEVWEADGLSPASDYFLSVAETSGGANRRRNLNPRGNRTRSNSSFIASPLPLGGEYAVIIRKGNRTAISAPLRVDEETPLPTLKLTLPLGTTVRGKLVNEKGEPLPLIPYTVTLEIPFHTSFTSGGAMTDGNGNFIVEGINFDLPGRWQLTFQPASDHPTTVTLTREQPAPSVIHPDKK